MPRIFRLFAHIVIAALAASALMSVTLAEVLAAGSRGLTIQMRHQKGKPTNQMRLYGTSRALVIGIDNYTEGWPSLDMAVADARAVADELEQRGFDVTLKTNLNSVKLDKTLKEFFAIQGADPEARLFLWFAGHGHTINGEGFLVPTDAPPANDPAFKVKALHMRDFGGLVRLADAKHVLSVFDSCFSGTIFTSRSAGAPAAIGLKTAKPVRQFLTSGDAGQTVRDDGSFRELFLRAIRGDNRADINADGYVTGDELGLYLSQEVTHLTGTAQTPRWGRLQDVRFNEGDFVFEATDLAALPAPPTAEKTPSKPSVSEHAPEVVFWKSIRNSDDPSDFEAYLANFPDGLFADLARNRLARLAAPATTSKDDRDRVEPMEATFVVLKNANLRAGPNVKARRLGSAQKNAGIVVTGHVPGRPWYRMRLPDGVPAFIHARLIKEVDPAELIAWYRVKQSDNYHAYRRFVRRFPNGHFTRQARRIGKALYQKSRGVRPPPRYKRPPPPPPRPKSRAQKRQEERMINDLIRLFGQVARQAGQQ